MLEKEADSLQVLILGTSQTLHSLNPALFDRPAINLAASAQPLYYDSKIVLSYLTHLKKLKLIILPLDYFSLFFDVETLSQTRSLEYSRFWNINHPSIGRMDFRKYSLLALFKPATSKEIFLQMINEKKLSIRFQTYGMLDNGFWAATVPADTTGFEKTAFLKVKKWGDLLMFKNNFTQNAQTVETLIQTLQKRNIKVLLISTPIVKNIYEKYDSSFIRLRLNFVQHISAKYSNTTYHDFSKDPRFNIGDFFDPNHLDAAGAVKFSKIINDEYVNPMIH